MKKQRIQNIRIYQSDKKSPVSIPEAVSRLHVQWLERELKNRNYDKTTKIDMIHAIIKELHTIVPV